MADTLLSVRANRVGAMIYLGSSVTGVALDATISESFYAPQEVGDLYIHKARFFSGASTGTYVAPSYVPIGCNLSVVSSDLATYIDHVGISELYGRIVVGWQADFDPNYPILLRRNERLIAVLPAIGSAGSTAAWTLEIRARRLPYGFA